MLLLKGKKKWNLHVIGYKIINEYSRHILSGAHITFT